MELSEYQEKANRTLDVSGISLDWRDEVTVDYCWTLLEHVDDVAVQVVQLLSAEKWGSESQRTSAMLCVTGLIGETGELIELVKKQVFHSHAITYDDYLKEVGDVMWYWSGSCTTFGYLCIDVANEYRQDDSLFNALGATFTALKYLCGRVGVKIEDALEMNIQKLEKRYPKGFSSDDSVKRVDVRDA